MSHTVTRLNNRDVVYIALFAAVVAVLGLVPKIPLPFIPVPITAQTLGVMLAGSILGAKRGGLALVVFLLLVAAGMPLLAGGRGGLGVFLGPSGGFLVGFPLGAYVVGLLTERFWRRFNFGYGLLANCVGGIGVVYAVGIPWLAIATDSTTALASVAFIPGDSLKAILATLVAIAVKRSYPLIRS